MGDQMAEIFMSIPQRVAGEGTLGSRTASGTRDRVLARRSHLELRMDILKAVRMGAEKPTQIMYKANLSWEVLQAHLKALLEKGALVWVAEGSRKRYELTPKGSSAMYFYTKILEEVGEENGSLFAER